MKFHLGFPSGSIADLKMPDNAPLAKLGESLGFDTLWHSNERFYREMFVRMTSSAMVTSRIGIGGAIAEPFSIHPALTAQALATVDELSGGRATVALGAGGSGFQAMGVKRQRSALALREAYQVINGLRAGQEVTLEGEMIQSYQARLQFVPEQQPVQPLWIATRGDVTLRTAGEYADAVMIATYANSQGVGEALALVREGIRKSGRQASDVRIMSRVDTCLHADPQVAYAGTRMMLARVLWVSYPDRNFVRRAGLEVPPDVEALIARRDLRCLPDIVERLPDSFVDAFSWAGTPEMVADRVKEIAAATGIQEFGFWMLLAEGQTREEAVRLLAEQLIPLL